MVNAVKGIRGIPYRGESGKGANSRIPLGEYIVFLNGFGKKHFPILMNLPEARNVYPGYSLILFKKRP